MAVENKTADELKPSDNVYRDGYIYTISKIEATDPEYLIVTVISPRVVEDLGFEPVNQFRWHRRRPITIIK